MKKVYKKPEILFESFTFSTNIAGNCAIPTNTPNSRECSYSYKDEFGGELNLFLNDIKACTDKDDDGYYNGLCYHVPVENNNLFNS